MLLIIHKDEKNANAVREMFRFMNLLSYTCKPQDAKRELSPRYRAVLILNPESFPDIQSFVTSLRDTAALTPVFAMTREHLPVGSACLFAKVFSFDTLSSTLAKEMVSFSLDHGLPAVGDYRLSGVNVSADLDVSTFCGKPFPLTNTEKRILQFLIRTYPDAATAEEILDYAFHPLKTPGKSSVRTHLCAINRKFRALTGRPLSERAEPFGYRIVTPKTKNYTPCL